MINQYFQNFKKHLKQKKMQRDTFKCSKHASFSQKNL